MTNISDVLTKVIRCVCGVVLLGLIVGCKSMPTLEQQEQLVQANSLVLDQITTRAVVNVWGKPPLYHSEFSHFFVMSDFSVIPRSRVATGEIGRAHV